MNRVRAGWCAVPNPLNMKQVSTVSLDPREVDAIVFWSKNPAPLVPHLDELDKRGFRYYFQFSLNDYPTELEPKMPSIAARLRTFGAVSQHVGPQRVVWRYDPIIISNITPIEFHRERFSWIAERLHGVTRRVMVSIVDFYQKTDRRLSHLEQEGFRFDREAASSASMVSLLKDLATTAKAHDIEIFSCAEARHDGETEIPPGRCIDERLLNRLWSLNLRYRKDGTQREFCLCMASKDIGINDTCIHGCPYCYATRNQALAERRYREHDPSSPAIWGDPEILQNVESQQAQQMRLFEQ